MYDCDLTDYKVPKAVTEANDYLAAHVKREHQGRRGRGLSRLDAFAEALYQLYENLKAAESFVRTKHGLATFDPNESNAIECVISHRMPAFPPIDPRCLSTGQTTIRDSPKGGGAWHSPG